MDKQPPNDERVIEALEACRAGDGDPSDLDLADPALVELRRRIQGTDDVIAAVMQDVPIPDGLAARLLERLETSRPRPRRVSRRWAVVGGSLLTVAAGLLIAAWIGISSATPYDESIVLAEAIELFNSEQAAKGFLLSENQPPASYPFSRDVLRIPGISWRKINDFLGREGIAYDLRGQGGSLATLYVVNRKLSCLSGVPARNARRNTGGVLTSAWQDGDLLYVLVVRGGPRSYRSFLAPLGPVA